MYDLHTEMSVIMIYQNTGITLSESAPHSPEYLQFTYLPCRW